MAYEKNIHKTNMKAYVNLHNTTSIIITKSERFLLANKRPKLKFPPKIAATTNLYIIENFIVAFQPNIPQN